MATRLKLPSNLNAALMAFMGAKGISVMDKNIVIARAVEAYLKFMGDGDAALDEYITARVAERVRKGKESRK